MLVEPTVILSKPLEGAKVTDLTHSDFELTMLNTEGGEKVVVNRIAIFDSQKDVKVKGRKGPKKFREGMPIRISFLL